MISFVLHFMYCRSISIEWKGMGGSIACLFQYLTNLDGGVNCKLKVTSIHKPGSEPHRFLQFLPSNDDTQWTKQLWSLPSITFSTIYDSLVSRNVLLKKVQHIENVAETEDSMLLLIREFWKWSTWWFMVWID